MVALDHLRDGCLIVAKERRVDGSVALPLSYLNAAARSLLGCARQDAIGRELSELFPGPNGSRLRRQLLQLETASDPLDVMSLDVAGLYGDPEQGQLARLIDLRVCRSAESFVLYLSESRDTLPDPAEPAAVDARSSLPRPPNAAGEVEGSTLDPRSFASVVGTVFEVCKQQSGASAGYVALRREGEADRIVFVDSGAAACRLDIAPSAQMQQAGEEAYRLGRVLIRNGVADSPGGFLSLDSEMIESMMFVPITLGAGVAGMIALAKHQGGFSADEERRARNVGEIAGIALDRQHSLEQLLARERLLTATGRMAKIGGWELDARSGAISWTAVTREIHQVSGDFDPSLGAALEFYHPDDRSRVRAAVDAALRRGEPFDLDARLTTAAGAEIWTHSRCTPIVEDGRVVKLVGTFQDITEYKRTLDRLADRERLLRLLTDNMFDLVALAGLDGRIVYASPSHRQLGYEPRELIGQLAQANVHPEDLARVEIALAEVLRTNEPGSAEYRHRRVDGSYVWIESMGKVVLDDDGQPAGLIFSSRDISARKQVIDQLAARESRFRTLFHNSLAPIVIVDDDGRCIDANLAACELFGRRHDELLQMSVNDFKAPSPQSVATQFARYREAASSHGEFGFIRPDGTYRTVLFTLARVAEREHAAVLRDVTELKQVEESLRAEKDRAQRYLDIAAVMLLGLDASGTISLINRRGCEVLGVSSASALIGAEWSRCLPAGDRGPWRLVFQAIMRGEMKLRRRVESRVLRPSGEERLIVWHHALLRDERGQAVGILSSGEDVTERRQMETQLAQADRLSSMGMLAAGVAHEINNPLSYALYNIESLAEDVPSLLRDVAEIDSALLDDVVQRLDDALEGTQRIRQIVSSLGIFSRVDQETPSLVDLHRVIGVAINMSFNEVKYRARLVQELEPVPRVLADEGRLSQVFINLLVNAAHAIDEGDVENNEIRIRTWSDGESVYAQVRDSGSGIAPAHLRRLFEPFFTTKRLGFGSGLGLSITKSIIEGYDGTIEVESELGVGSIFTIRLPIRRGADVPPPSSESQATAAARRARILIVDDEEGIRSVIARMLREHECVGASSGAEAKRLLLEDQAFDVILCDLMMSEVTGVELDQWLSSAFPRLASRLVFITGGAFTPRARQYLAESDKLQLEKPFDIDRLRSTVRDIIERSDAGATA
ncbi:MAG: PAS domain S-box protein [Myxococcales bacterium]|nr:PAS domain S-box protein [Myxococcales bacterium]